MNEHNASVDELMELERRLCQMFQDGEVDAALDYLLEDALVCPPGTDAVVGRENQKVMFKQFLDMEGTELSWEPIEARVSSSEDMGYVYGSVEWKLPNEPKQLGKYISIWVKENDRWRNAVEIRNANA